MSEDNNTSDKRIRLACIECDTNACDGIDKIPEGWGHVSEFQSYEESLAYVSPNDKTRSVLDWYTHLGVCPKCQAEPE